MANLGVNIAILVEDQILLTKREDFEVWCLPGGEVDPNESIAQAAVREAWEETGLEVRLSRLVGIYSKPQWAGSGAHSVLFVAEPRSGALRLCPGETIEVGYFSLDEIPPDLLPWHQQMIRDARAGIGGSVAQRQEIEWPFPADMSRQAIYAQRDSSGLSRQQFFLQTLAPSLVMETIEVPGRQVGE
ncbi:MAG: NUDIX domain-containing protein [Caldilineaceae bacterium]